MLIGCVLAEFVWSGLRDMFQVGWNPKCYLDLEQILATINGKGRKVLRMIFSAVCWALWFMRNKFTIEAKFPKLPADCIFKILVLLQLWKPLLKEEAAPMLEDAGTRLKALFTATHSPPNVVP